MEYKYENGGFDFNDPDFVAYLEEVHGDKQLSEGEMLQAAEDYEKVNR